MEFLRPFMSDVAGMRRRIAAALDTLTREADRRAIGDISRRAAIGFCFGGLNVLDLARTGADVQAVVSMHGTLTTPQPAKRGDIKAAVLAVHGAADPIAPKAERDAFEAEMTAAGARWALLTFGDVVHALHRPAGQRSRRRGLQRTRHPPRLCAGPCLHCGCICREAVDCRISARHDRSTADDDGGLMHTLSIPQSVVDRVMARRGREHIYRQSRSGQDRAGRGRHAERASCCRGSPTRSARWRKKIVPNINRLARAVRATGGTVVWIKTTFTDEALTELVDALRMVRPKGRQTHRKRAHRRQQGSRALGRPRCRSRRT